MAIKFTDPTPTPKARIKIATQHPKPSQGGFDRSAYQNDYMKRARGETFVYVIGPRSGPLKIGIAADVSARLYNLQTCSPFPLFIHALWLTARRSEAEGIEFESHRILQKSHSHGEWFNCSLERAAEAIEIAGAIHPIDPKTIEIKATIRKPWEKRKTE
jgi:hypothetical protein